MNTSFRSITAGGNVAAMQVVKTYGTMWAKNKKNIQKVPSSSSGGVGIYVLFDGSTPVYVGKGNLRQRIKKARASRRRGQLWDRFSWYALRDPNMMHDIEVLIVKLLPPYLRSLTRQQGHFQRAERIPEADKRYVDYITRRVSRRYKKPRYPRK